MDHNFDGGGRTNSPDGNYPYHLQDKPHFKVPGVTYYFRSRQNAERAVEELAKAGFTEVDIDRVSRVGPTSDLPDGAFPTHLGAGDTAARRITDAAHFDTSGMSGPGLYGNAPYLVTVVLDDVERRQEAVDILKKVKERHPEDPLGEPPVAHGR